MGMCEGWNGMGGGKSMKKVGGVVGKWWGEWKHERTVVGRMGVCGECWYTGKGAMDMECHAWECAMDMETFLKGSRDGCDRVCEEIEGSGERGNYGAKVMDSATSDSPHILPCPIRY